ncbi:hypothetical protein MKW98_023400, partial [Papaver atlanticum]
MFCQMNSAVFYCGSCSCFGVSHTSVASNHPLCCGYLLRLTEDGNYTSSLCYRRQ